MTAGLTTFSTTGDAEQISPSVWADCRNTLLQDLGLGYFNHAEFLAADLVLANNNPAPGVNLIADASTVMTQTAAKVGGYLNVATAATLNNAFSLFSEPLGVIAKGSGQKLWHEVRVSLGQITAHGFFTGFIEEAGQSVDVVADGTSTLIGESLIGFVVFDDAPAKVQAVYRKDAGALVVLNSDVTNSTAIPAEERSNLVIGTEVKLGLRYDGRDKVKFYVNGYEVVHLTVDSTVDQVKTMCSVSSLKAGAGTATSAAFDWIRYASQRRS